MAMLLMQLKTKVCFLLKEFREDQRNKTKLFLRKF